MSPPGPMAESLIKAAHLVLENCNVRMSPSKVSRLVRDYQRHVAANGFPFLDFLVNAVQLTAEQRRQALMNPDIARVISYADPTGEAAVNNPAVNDVIRKRKELQR